MGHVVELPVRLPEADMFEHGDMARLYAAWRQSARAGDLPALREFAPRRLGQWMAWSGMVETTASNQHELMEGAAVYWRLAGSALCRLAGHELTRQPAFGDWSRFERSTLCRLVGQTLFQRQAFLARLRLEMLDTADGRMEMLSLPLRDTARGKAVALLVFRPYFPPDMVVPTRLSAARLLSLQALEGPRELQEEMAFAAGGDAAGMAKVLPLFTQSPAHA